MSEGTGNFLIAEFGQQGGNEVSEAYVRGPLSKVKIKGYHFDLWVTVTTGLENKVAKRGLAHATYTVECRQKLSPIRFISISIWRQKA